MDNAYRLFPDWFEIKPQHSFDEAWEVFCCELLNLENGTNRICRISPHDDGIDLFWEEKGIAYQCKSVIDGRPGSFNVSKAEDSIKNAIKHQKEWNWQKYVLCTNVDITGSARKKLKAILPDIEILGSTHYWIPLCRKFDHDTVVTSRFPYQFHSQPESIWNIPSYLMNPFFTDREEVLKQIYERVSTDKMVALTGLGGIGKTQCAVKYAFDHKGKYTHVFWVGASTRETLMQSYTEIASLLHLPVRIPAQDKLDQDKIVEAVIQWLHGHYKWLLIADDAEDLNVAFTFLPTMRTGHILITGRDMAARRVNCKIDIPKMGLEKGSQMLLYLAKLLSLNDPLDQARQQDREQAQKIVREMDGLPLALDQVGAYIEENQSSLVEYLEAYKDKRKQIDLLDRRGGYIGDHPNSVATTLSLSFEQVEKNSPLSADVMRVCAFLAPDDIPEDIFVRGADIFGLRLRTLTNDPALLRDAVGKLAHFSLMRRDPDKHTLSLHRLVQIVVRSAMEDDEQEKWVIRVIYALKNMFPSSSDIASWEICQQYLPHALVGFELIKQYNITSIEAVLLLQNVANYQSERASYDTIEQMYEHALTIIEQHHPHHDTLANILYNFARFYYVQGVYGEAESLLQKAKTINEQDTNEINMARYHNLLAACYYKQENFEEAEELLKLALVISEQSLDPYHPDTAMSLNNLAVLYYAQIELKPENEPEKVEQAEMLYQRAFFIHAYSLGLNHPDTAMSLNNMAVFYYLKKEYEQAEVLLQYALTIYGQSLGFDHPDTAMSLYNLAKLYTVQEKYEQTETCYNRSLAIYAHTLGPQHLITNFVRDNYKVFQPQMLTEPI